MLGKGSLGWQEQTHFPFHLLKYLYTKETPTSTPTTTWPWGDFQSAFCHLFNPESGFLTVGNESLSALRELS